VSKLNTEQDVIEYVGRLGLTGKPVEAVIKYCKSRIATWTSDASNPTDITLIERIVCEHLQLTFVDFYSDDELVEACRNYAAQGDAVFASVPTLFDDGTYGTLIKRGAVADDAPDKYVAFIDCRGDKAARRFFTRWHEIAHLLTLVDDDALPVQRAETDPVERLMDEIAGHIGFPEELLRPIVDRVAEPGRLTLSATEDIRQEFCAEASYQATLFACLRVIDTPAIYLEAEIKHKVSDQRRIDSPQAEMFPDDKPEAKLRTRSVRPNDQASSMDFAIHPNMRVPESSLIHKLHQAETMDEDFGAENLDAWTFSTGGGLPACPVWVEARKVKDRVFAIVQPTNS